MCCQPIHAGLHLPPHRPTSDASPAHICRPTGPHLPSRRPTFAAPPVRICRPTGPQMKACRLASDRQDEKKDLETVYSLTTTLKHIFGWIPIKEFSQTIDIYCCQVNSKRPKLSCPKPHKIGLRADSFNK